ncbi:hypothetical protein KKD03_02275 [Patescibacteria group bacterium]|nr:hypothetical protein [Patescibacteria group bacterium]
MNKPTIIIVAGGENSRFFPINTETHKGFLSLAGKPMFVRALENLKKYEFGLAGTGEKIIVVVSQKDFNDKGFSKYLKENNLASKLGLNIEVVLQKKAKGMGDALLTTKEFFSDLASDSFILASPYHLNLGEIAQELWQKKQSSDASCVLSATQTKSPEMYGILDLNPDNYEEVIGITEKLGITVLPKRNSKKIDHLKVNSIYLFDNNFTSELINTPEKEYSLETAITKYANKSKITWLENTKENFSLKYPWQIFSAFGKIIQQKRTSISESAKISKTSIIDDSNGPIIIEDTAKIGDYTKIVGPCYIGRNVFVGDYSFIRGSSIEEGCTIGANTEVVRCIFFENTTMHYGYISDSILGSSTRVGAGLITANKRFDRNGVKVKIKGKMIDSKRKSLGVITGSNVQIGIRTNTMPGVLIGKNSIIYPGLTIDANIEENETVKK